MNYACATNKPFVTTKSLPKQVSLSSDAKARREYIRNHNFVVDVNPSTMQTEITVTSRR